MGKEKEKIKKKKRKKIIKSMAHFKAKCLV